MPSTPLGTEGAAPCLCRAFVSVEGGVDNEVAEWVGMNTVAGHSPVRQEKLAGTRGVGDELG